MLNLTPHTISIIDQNSVTFKPEIRKFVSESPIILKTIPSSGMVSVSFKEEYRQDIDGVPCKMKWADSVDPLPSGNESCIVSALYYSTNPDRRCYTIVDPVYDITGTKVIGCLGVGKLLDEEPMPTFELEAIPGICPICGADSEEDESLCSGCNMAMESAQDYGASFPHLSWRKCFSKHFPKDRVNRALAWFI